MTVPSQADSIKTQIVAVVVLYKRLPGESETIQTLAGIFEASPDLLRSISVLVWDNSPVGLDNPTLSFPFQYRHAEYNAGVSAAYNRAMEFAESIGCPWLLLLDHDTTLPGNFLARMLEYSRELEGASRVAAIAPFVRRHDTEAFFSPTELIFLNRSKNVPRSFHGIHEPKALAINSGTLLRVSALREIGGYNEDFWLDLSDIYVFRRLYQAGKRLYIAGDLEIRHYSAMLDYTREMSAERYRNYMYAEDAYLTLCFSRFENAVHPLRLLVRSYRQYRRYKNKVFSRITMQFFFHRVLRTKARRLRMWKQYVRLYRDIPATLRHGAVN